MTCIPGLSQKGRREAVPRRERDCGECELEGGECQEGVVGQIDGAGSCYVKCSSALAFVTLLNKGLSTWNRYSSVVFRHGGLDLSPPPPVIAWSA